MKLEFIELPFLNLGKSGKIRTGAGFNSSDFKTEGVPLIKIGNIKNNQIDISDCSYISENEKKINLTRENDLLIAMRGATSGKLGIVSKQFENCFYVGSIGNLGEINDELIYRPFIKYIEQQLYDILKTESKGTATPMVSIGMLEKFKLVIPKTKEQQKYLFELLEKRKNQVGELTTELTHQLSLVKKLRQQLLQDAVKGKLVKQDKKDVRAKDLLEKIKAEKQKLIAEKKLKKEKELPPIKPEEIPFEIPENWAWCRLGKIALHSEAGKSYQAQEIAAQENQIGVIKTSAITSGYFIEDENKFVPNQNVNIDKIIIEKGDIIFCRASGSKGLAGKSCFITVTPKAKLILSDKSIRYVFSDNVYKMYIQCFNSSIFAEQYYINLGTKKSTTMNNITREQFNSLPIPLPPLSEQKRIVQKLDELMQYCHSLEASIKESQEQNEKLLQQVLREALRKEPVNE